MMSHAVPQIAGNAIIHRNRIRAAGLLRLAMTLSCCSSSDFHRLIYLPGSFEEIRERHVMAKLMFPNRFRSIWTASRW
jgi:hypothetical protein